MKSLKLTPKQKEVYQLLHNTENGLLRRHIKPTGLVCWRVLDQEANPLKSVSERIVDALLEKNLLERDKSGQNYILKATIDTEPDYSNIGLAKAS